MTDSKMHEDPTAHDFTFDPVLGGEVEAPQSQVATESAAFSAAVSQAEPPDRKSVV